MNESRQELFDRLMGEHGAALRRLARSRERDPSRAEDLMQDIALAFWRALPRFRGAASPKTYLFRIAHNRAMSHAARGARRSREEADGEPAEETAATAAGPEERAIERQRSNRLRQAIRRLQPTLRDAVVLRLEGMSHREIAAILGLMENNVAVRLTRARRALTEALADPQEREKR